MSDPENLTDQTDQIAKSTTGPRDRSVTTRPTGEQKCTPGETKNPFECLGRVNIKRKSLQIEISFNNQEKCILVAPVPLLESGFAVDFVQVSKEQYREL